MLKQIISIAFTILTIPECAGSSTGTTTGPEPVKRDAQYCSAAQSHLQTLCNENPVKNKLCCDMVKLTPKQHSFEQVCQAVMDGGIYLNPLCVATVVSCEQVDSLCLQNDAGGNK